MLVGKQLPNVTVMPLSSFEDDRLRAVKPTRSWREYIWTCTPGWMLHVLTHEDSVTYVDADIMFFANPEPVYQEIGSESLAITPHDFPRHLRHLENNGKYNVGLVFARRDGLVCLREWERLCLNWCYLRHEPEYPDWFCDQKYWDTLEKMWHVHAIQHPGANRAPWNLEHRRYDLRGGRVFVDGEPLLWYHYHGYQGAHEMHPSTYSSTSFQRRYIYEPYMRALERVNG